MTKSTQDQRMVSSDLNSSEVCCKEPSNMWKSQDFGSFRISSKFKNVALWTLQVVTAAAFLMAGIAKLAGNPMMVETFEHVGIGQWFRYVTALIEIASAVMLLIPRTAAIGAGLLIFTMSGAVLAHLTVLGGSPVPALVLLCFSAVILVGRFGVIAPVLSKLFASANRADRLSPERRAATQNGVSGATLR